MSEIPIRQDITVLLADDPSKPMRLPFVILDGEIIAKEENVFVPYTEENENHYEEIDVDGVKPKILKNRLKRFEDVSDGDIVYSKYYGDEIVAMKVENIDVEKRTAWGKLNDNCWGNLSFDSDFRGCWTCGGYMFINDKCLVDCVIV
jgi:hypothetical protein